MKHLTRQYDLVVAGGGLAGVCAALAAARHGAKTVLIQNRPVLGGNASGEFRMHVCGADRHSSHANLRETGILEEVLLEAKKRADNPDFWPLDTVLWDKCSHQENLTLLLNTHVTGVNMQDGRIASLSALQLTSETALTIEGKLFIDATGDGTVADLAGADWTYGRESRETYGEQWAPEEADTKVMGSSLLFTARDMGKPVPFECPDFAYHFTEEQLDHRDHSDVTSGYWWIELGGDELNTIYDSEEIYNELVKTLYGVWDHIKNGGDHGAENMALTWISPVAGKRESRRVLGDYVLREQDLLSERVFSDAVAYGGWSMDCHVPGGIRSSTNEPTQYLGEFGAYTIPYRSLYSRNVDNLMTAGRIVSCSHLAFSSLRVMATCAVIGQASGTAAAIALEEGISPREVGKSSICKLQNQLMRDDCWIPGFAAMDPADAALDAAVTASDYAGEAHPGNVTNGYLRTVGGSDNSWTCAAEGEQWLNLKLREAEELDELVIRFDSNLSREITPTINVRIRAHECIGVPPELVKDYTVELKRGGEVVRTIAVTGNAQRLNRHSLDGLICDEITIRPTATNGSETYRIFSVNAYRAGSAD